MQQVRTETEKLVDLFPYKFSVYEMGGEVYFRIGVSVIRVNGGDFSTGDLEAIQSIFADTGKWEAFVGAASTVLVELGLAQRKDEGEMIMYSAGRFVFKESDSVHSALAYHMSMSKEERDRREVKRQWPTSGEIAHLIQNVGKWRALQQTVKLLRSFIPATD